MKPLLTTLITLFLLSTTQAQQTPNVKGIWQLAVETSVGSGSPEFELKHLTDSTLEGTYRGQLGETPVKGILKGNKIFISFNISGNEIEYDGIVEGDTMKGKLKLGTMGEGTFTGSRKK